MKIADKWLDNHEEGFNLIPSDLWDEVSGLIYRGVFELYIKDEELYMLHLVGKFLGESESIGYQK